MSLNRCLAPNRSAWLRCLLLAPILSSLAWILAASEGGGRPRREVFDLRPDVPVERQLAVDEVHVYRAELGKGSWSVAVEQRGIDVVAAAGREGRSSTAAASPTDRWGTMWLPVLAVASAGVYEVEIRPAQKGVPPGRYEIRLRKQSALIPDEDRRRQAEQLSGEAARLYSQDRPDSRRQSLERFREALRQWRGLEAKREAAATLLSLAAVSRESGETRAALELFQQALGLFRELGDRALAAETGNEIGLTYQRLGETGAARAAFEEARARWQSLGNRSGEAIARSNICLTRMRDGDWTGARVCYEEVLELLGALSETDTEARALTNLGGVYANCGEPDRALEHYRRSLALTVALGEQLREAQIRNNLGALHRGLGETQEALFEYSRALAVFEQLGNRYWQARCLNNLGYAYLGIGELERAASWLRQALPWRRKVGDRRGEAVTLNNLGRVEARRGNFREARELHRQALTLSRALEDRRGEAIALQLLGEADFRMDDRAAALEHLQRALELQRAIGNRLRQAEIHSDLGELLSERGEPRQARAYFDEALALHRAISNPAGEVETLYAAARAERRRGRPEVARTRLEAALDLVEDLRTRVSDPNRRASYLSSQHGAYELLIDLLMELDRDQPGRGHDHAALEVSERARARSLLELVAEPGNGIDEAAAGGALGERLRAARRRVDAQLRRQLEVLGARHGDEEADAVEQDLDAVLNELENVEAEVRRQSPRYAALTRPALLSAGQVQELLEPGTTLLEYVLGEERSFLWAVTASSIASFELAPRSVIEDLARRAFRELATLDLRTGRTRKESAAALARELLGPIAEQLARPATASATVRRLVVVADGALHYVPFAALPVPGSDGSAAAPYEPLLLRYEVVYLPSASVLATERQQAGRTSAQRSVAVLADPVFDRRDSRLAGADPAPDPASAAAASSVTRSARQVGLARLGRLSRTRDEALAIAALADDGQALVALDFAASRALVLSGELRPYRFLHFATHGMLNPQSPELSGLVLSLYDSSGRDIDGFLRLHDVYGLDLEAELVVLSGCQTALGREIRGEGLVGLTRGFLYAGVPRVVASLWQVQEQAAAELMARFYRAMLVDGRRPAAALRAAQLSLRQEKRWADPFYWAAFLLQGDWR